MLSQLWKTSAWLWIGLLLAACAGAPAVGGGEVLPVEAQRVIDHATATAQAVATQSAFATATRVSSLEQAEAARTATAEAISSTVTALEVERLALEVEREKAQATFDAMQLRAAATHTQAALEVQAREMQRREEQATLASGAGWVIGIVFLIVAAALLVALGWHWVQAQRRRWQSSTALMDTKYGPAKVKFLPSGQLRLTLLAPPARVAESLKETAGPEVREFFVGPERKLRETMLDNAKTARLRAELAELMQAAIAVNGAESRTIPRHDDMGMGGSKRGRLVGALKAAGLVQVSGDGTTLAGERTLYSLLCDLKECRVRLNPVEVVNATP